MLTPCRMMTATLALALPAPFAQACPAPERADMEATNCTQPLTIINRTDSFIITRRSAPVMQPMPRPASFLRLPSQRLGSNIWLDSEMLDANRPSPALPSEDQEQSK